MRIMCIYKRFMQINEDQSNFADNANDSGCVFAVTYARFYSTLV